MSAEWLQWTVLVLAAFGLAAVLRDGELFEGVRQTLSRVRLLGVLMRCWLCLGWWCGIPAAYAVGIRGRLVFVAPFVASGVVYVIGTHLGANQIEDIPPAERWDE